MTFFIITTNTPLHELGAAPMSPILAVLAAASLPGAWTLVQPNALPTRGHGVRGVLLSSRRDRPRFASPSLVSSGPRAWRMAADDGGKEGEKQSALRVSFPTPDEGADMGIREWPGKL